MGLFQMQSAISELTDSELIRKWIAKEFDEHSRAFAEQELMDRGIDSNAPVPRAPVRQTAENEEIVDWSFQLAVVAGKVLVFVGIIVGFGICKMVMEKYIGIGGAIPNILLFVPFMLLGRKTYQSRSGKWALLIVTGALALLTLVVVFGR